MTNKEFCLNYFNEYEDDLVRTYPGINSNQLTVFFCEYYQVFESETYLTHRDSFFKSIKEGYPLQYLIKKAYFYTSSFYVDERVLIPRPETEILVETIVKKVLKQKKMVDLCEVGIGSGAIFLSLIEHIGQYLSHVLATDISKEAIQVSQINQKRLKKLTKTTVSYKKTDRLCGVEGHFDIIVSNPPYISTKDSDGVHSLVDKHEPKLALYIDDETYSHWFEKFFIDIKKCLNNTGFFMMEGHEDKLVILKELANQYFDSVEIIKDYTGRDRFLIGEKNG